ncbi:MAG: A/G-specific adenine glycosylase [Candidatus Limivicinus sp.]
MINETERIEQCLPLIVAWYQQVRRPLPWRQEPAPYHVWLSEIMLQQTRIEAAIPYYHRFLAQYPTVAALAQAEEEQLMKLWEGLGYYSRARNLKKAAVRIVEQYGGRLPQQAVELKKLPGIGDYTAGAIASIAYGQPEPAVDGNVLRVLARLLASREDIALAGTKARFTALLRQSYPSGREAALLTEGIMELGETICIPNGEAKCAACPLQAHCLAHETDTVARYPVKSPPKERRLEQRTVLLLHHNGRYAIRKREGKGLLAGLWEFPNVLGRLSPAEAIAWAEAQGLTVTVCTPCPGGKHIFTHVEWHMDAYLLDCTGETGDFLWQSPQEIKRDFSVPTAFRFCLKLISGKAPERK